MTATTSHSTSTQVVPPGASAGDATEDVRRVLGRLRTRLEGLTQREAARRLESDGPNELVRRSGGGLPQEVVRQLVHPLALLLWLAAALSALTASYVLAIAIVVVIGVNALFAVVQERHAEQAVEALASYLPQSATVMRDGERRTVPARELVRGDIIVIAV